MARKPSTPAQRRVARDMDRERKALERSGVRAALRIGTRLRVAVMADFEAGRREFTGPLDAAGLEFATLLAEGMVASHLTGALRATNMALKPVEAVRTLQVYDQAIEFSRRRLDLTQAQIDELIAKYGERSVLAAQGISNSMEIRLRRAVAEITEEGITAREGAARIGQEFRAAGVVGRTEGGVAIGPHLHETLFRTNVAMAYGAGRWEVGQDPAVQDILWGYTYVTVGDEQVRDEHIVLDGVTLPKEDPEWLRIWPPNGWNCRCTTIELFDPPASVVQPESVVVDGETIRPDPDPGFDFNPGVAIAGTLPGI